VVENDCVELVNEYVEWLRDNISVVDVDGICEVTTPFLDRHNDHLQIYIKEEDGQYTISDDAYILTDLEMSGLEINTENRKAILNEILAGFGVNKVDDELQVKAQRHNLAQRKHNLIQAMLAVNDMFVMARPYVASFFREDVEQFLHIHKVRFITMVSFMGRSGFTHTFDFAIPPSEKRPERIVKAINNPSRDNISSLIFSWNDTREVRSSDARAYAVLNDLEKNVSGDAMNALEAYRIIPMLWSAREKYVGELAT
jgi:hypothetical protein